MLAAAAREVGGVQIQNRGTIGGNVANASPAGDTLPVLLAADAVVVLRSAAGTRRVPMTSFYTGYRQTVARPDELIVGFEIPARARAAVVPQGRHARGAGDREDRRRRRVGHGARRRAAASRDGQCGADRAAADADRSALGSGASLAEAQAILQREIAPIDDLRSTAEYRRQVAANLLAQFYAETRPFKKARSVRL